MRFKWAYIPIGLVCALFFSINTEAATSVISTNINDGSGTSVTVNANQFTSRPYDEQEQLTNTNGVTEQVFKWHLSQNISLTNLTKNHYYSGILYFRLNFGKSTSILTQGKVELSNTYVTEGVNAYIQVGEGYAVINIIFDNFFTESTEIGLPTLTYEFYVSRTSYSDSQLIPSFSTSFSSTSGANLHHTTSPYNDGFAGVLSHMIGYAISSSQEFDDINTLLTAIRDQDALYYTSLTTACANILAQTTISNTKLQQIIEDNNANFSAIQNILVLFPSYRTAVLQYWQELLQMNAAQSSQAAENESQYQDKESQSESLVAGMGDLTLPSISSNDLDIFSQTDSGTRANFFGLIAMITHNDFIVRIFLIVATASLIGFILYGKKG